MHDKILGRISDEIARRRREGCAGIIMMAGPSSSGKTTTGKRLSIQLMTNLIKPKMISLDDYFVDRVRTPLDENGEYDYESLYAPGPRPLQLRPCADFCAARRSTCRPTVSSLAHAS